MRLSSSVAYWLLAFAVIVAFASLRLGFVGVKTVFAFVLLFIVPLLVLIRKLPLDFEEKLFFSLFLGISFFALSVWYVNQLLPSFRVSIFVAFALFIIAAAIAPKLPELFRLKKKPKASLNPASTSSQSTQ